MKHVLAGFLVLLSLGFVVSAQEEGKFNLTAEENQLIVELMRNILVTPIEKLPDIKMDLVARVGAKDDESPETNWDCVERLLSNVALVENIIEHMQPFLLRSDNEVLLITQSISQDAPMNDIEQAIEIIQAKIEAKTKLDLAYYGSHKNIQDQLLLAQLFSLKLHRLVDPIDESTFAEQVDYALEQVKNVIQYKRSHDTLYEGSQDHQEKDGKILLKVVYYHAMHDIKPVKSWYQIFMESLRDVLPFLKF